jgi:ribosomal protein L25 (general stress protein Ctc)
MDPIQLSTQSRDQFGTTNAAKLRSSGLYPATIVGGGKETVQLSLDAHAFDAAMRQSARSFVLDGEGGGERVALHALQFDAMGDDIMQIDFLRDPDGSRAAELVTE